MTSTARIVRRESHLRATTRLLVAGISGLCVAAFAGSAGAQQVVFADGFESGGLAAGGWTATGDFTISSVAYSGAWSARIDDTGSLTTVVDASGTSTLQLQYAGYTYAYDSGEALLAEVSTDGSSWTLVDTHVGGWELREVALPAAAAGQPALRIRFRSNASGFYERFRVDDVVLVGDGGQQPGNEPPVFLEDPVTAADATAGSAYAASIAGSASDPDGDPLSYGSSSTPPWLELAADGSLTGTPSEGDVGLWSFPVTVSDGNGGSDSATLEIVVQSSGGPGNPYARGPDPTTSVLEADLGPFDVGSYRPSSTPGFGSGTIWYPTGTSEGPFAAIAVCPGYLGSEDTMAWVGPRLASNGFVVITIQPDSIFDFPGSRADQLMAALDTVVDESNGSSPIAGLVDGERTGLMGHSMGGGGTLLAARDNPSVDAIIPLAPWNSSTTDFSDVEADGLVVACESDGIAPVASHAWPFYQSLSGVEKAFMEFDNEDHYCVMTGNDHYATLGKYIVSWMKRFLDEDDRYEPFLCGAPHQADLQTGELSDYRETCPYTP